MTSNLPTDDTPPGSDESWDVVPDVAKLEALAEFAAGAGHEINNPLATIIGRAQLLLKGEQDPQRRQMLLSIGAQAYRIRDMIGDVMLFGRPPLPDLADVDLVALLHRVRSSLADKLAEARCTVQIVATDSISLRADPTQISILVSELLKNSQHALQPAGGEIRVFAALCDKIVQIEIQDEGCGFSALERQHAFDPFFSGRQAGRGLGFGLAKCWRIVGLHQGSIQIHSSPAGPTIVKVELPRSPEHAFVAESA
jgi:signal transduction histidine kinase